MGLCKCVKIVLNELSFFIEMYFEYLTEQLVVFIGFGGLLYLKCVLNLSSLLENTHGLYLHCLRLWHIINTPAVSKWQGNVIISQRNFKMQLKQWFSETVAVTSDRRRQDYVTITAHFISKDQAQIARVSSRRWTTCAALVLDKK